MTLTAMKPEYINDAAANLFWTMAINLNVAGVCDSVIETSGNCLFEQPETDKILSEYGYHSLQEEEKLSMIQAIANEALKYCKEEKNLLGMIYSDDAETGRAPSAKDIDTKQLNNQPSKLDILSGEVDTIGRLCIRHPLPAVVFTDRLPLHDVIKVADTSTALGFQAAIFLSNFNILKIKDNLFVLIGVFDIATPSIEQGELWDMVIMNSTRFVKEFNYYSNKDTVRISVQW